MPTRAPAAVTVRAIALAALLTTLLGSAAVAPPARATVLPGGGGGTLDFEQCPNWGKNQTYQFGLSGLGLGVEGDTISDDLQNQNQYWFFNDQRLPDGSLVIPGKQILANDGERYQKDGVAKYDVLVVPWTLPSHAREFRLRGDGSFDYLRGDGYFGDDSFQYVVTLVDFLGVIVYCDVHIATITIDAWPYPILRDDTYDVDAVPRIDPVTRIPLDPWPQPQPFDLFPDCVQVGLCGVLANDLNPPPPSQRQACSFCSPYTVVAYRAPDGSSIDASHRRTGHGTLDPRQDGTFDYTPDPGYVGQDSFNYQYKVQDNNTQRNFTSVGTIPPDYAWAQVTLNVRPRPVNTVTAVEDILQATQDTALSITPAQLLSNDVGGFDIRTVSGDGDFLAADPSFGGYPLSRRTRHGTLAIGWLHVHPIVGPFWIGSLTYTPDQQYFGPDGFYYEARGDGASNWGVVSINVANTPDPPVANADFVTVHSGTSTSIDVLANDTDADQDIDPSSLHIIPDSPEFWSLNADSTITFSAPAGFYGTRVAVYGIFDATGLFDHSSVVARVTPLAPDTYALDEDTTLTVDAPGIRMNDSVCDHCDASVSVEVVDPPANGSVELDASGAFTYTPNANFAGVDTFTYRALGGDGAYAIDGETTIVTITVRNTPDAPTVALNDACAQDVPSDPCADDQDARVVQEGGAVRLRGYVTDPDPGFSGNLFVSWGDGTSTQIVPYPCLSGQLGPSDCQQTIWFTPTWSSATQSSDRMYFDLSHVYRDDPAGTSDTYRISVGAVDETGLAIPTGAVATATVVNGAPMLTLASPCLAVDDSVCISWTSDLTIATGSWVTLRGRVTDPGADTVNVLIDWGDLVTEIAPQSCSAGGACPDATVHAANNCEPLPSQPFLKDQPPICGYFAIQHQYDTPGDYTVIVNANDGDGGTDGPMQVTAHVTGTLPTPTPTGAPDVGDCDGDGAVTVNEIITLVNIALGSADASSCPTGIPSGAEVDIALIIQAVSNALGSQ